MLPLLDNCFSNLLTDVEIWYYKHFKFDVEHFLENKENPTLNMTVFAKISC